MLVEKSAQDWPGEPATRQKVFFTGFFSSGKGETNEKGDQQIARDGDQIERVK